MDASHSASQPQSFLAMLADSDGSSQTDPFRQESTPLRFELPQTDTEIKLPGAELLQTGTEIKLPGAAAVESGRGSVSIELTLDRTHPGCLGNNHAGLNGSETSAAATLIVMSNQQQQHFMQMPVSLSSASPQRHIMQMSLSCASPQRHIMQMAASLSSASPQRHIMQIPASLSSASSQRHFMQIPASLSSASSQRHIMQIPASLSSASPQRLAPTARLPCTSLQTSHASTEGRVNSVVSNSGQLSSVTIQPPRHLVPPLSLSLLTASGAMRLDRGRAAETSDGTVGRRGARMNRLRGRGRCEGPAREAAGGQRRRHLAQQNGMSRRGSLQ